MLQTAFNAARASGEILKKYYKNDCGVYKKGDFDIVTDADYESEKKAIEIISQKFPDHSFICEECGFSGNEDAEYKWLVDALDGTINFTRCVPLFSFSIALLKNEIPVLSVIYNPITEDLYYAEKGKGAYLNERKLFISKNINLKDSIIVSDLTKDRNFHEEFFKMLQSLSKEVLGIRLTQSTSINLAFVAEGRYDIFIKNIIKYYDAIAGALICEEAGGTVVDFSRNRISKYSKGIIVSNSVLTNKILEII
ncbi:MAG TPA: inositol monophosphatase family protein [Methanofastidiosum sp.]|nr:inositol monophosphatase family protein [Methanofastidiosum sp.]HNU61635.1 inositol monophosphatase family protein [Methanofastidiosum sp.]HOI77557.1 inositol monophosphatase family protein [Methanofastidiosum sp.]